MAEENDVRISTEPLKERVGANVTLIFRNGQAWNGKVLAVGPDCIRLRLTTKNGQVGPDGFCERSMVWAWMDHGMVDVINSGIVTPMGGQPN